MIALYVTIANEISHRLVNEKTLTTMSVWAAEAGIGQVTMANAWRNHANSA
jgi:hypothetical protein